jgi:hypothetical protein
MGGRASPRAARKYLADIRDTRTQIRSSKYSNNCRNAEAIECLKRALDADPTYADAMFNMGLLVFYSAGDNSRSSARDGLERSRRRACAFALFS